MSQLLMRPRGIMKEFPRIGNGAYYFIPEHSPTRYLVHHDLDMIIWNRPGKSWIADARGLLDSFPSERQIWHVDLPIPWYHRFLWKYDVGFIVFRFCRVLFSFEFFRWLQTS